MTLEQVACQRAGRVLVSGLDVSLTPGTALEIRGANGVGKSTLLRVMAGFATPAAGRIHCVAGAEPRQAKEISAYLGHADGVKTGLSVMENLSFWSRLYASGEGSQPREGAFTSHAAADLLGLGQLRARRAGDLSAGQRRRVALARILISGRSVWLLDEPTTALDTDGTALLEDIIAQHRARGGIAVVAIHGPLRLPGALLCQIGAPAASGADAGLRAPGPAGGMS